MEVAAVVLFALALVHTFATKFFERLAHRGGNHSGLRHLLGEVEVVFGFWAVVLIATMAAIEGGLARSSPRRSQTYEGGGEDAPCGSYSRKRRLDSGPFPMHWRLR